MTHRLSVVLVLTVVVVAAELGAGTANAQRQAPALDAEFETTFTLATGETFAAVGRYYRSAKGITREDSPRGSIITDVVRGTVTLLNPATKEARVFSVARRATPPVPEGAGRPEIFEEATTNKGHRISKARMKRGEQTDEIWTNRDLGVVEYSRVEGRDVTITKVVKNVAIGEPPANVFEIPRDYIILYETAPSGPENPERSRPDQGRGRQNGGNGGRP